MWGLTGTPLLSSETRITELAALCAGTYVCGSAAHWRTMERASTRDVFLRCAERRESWAGVVGGVGGVDGVVGVVVVVGVVMGGW